MTSYAPAGRVALVVIKQTIFIVVQFLSQIQRASWALV